MVRAVIFLVLMMTLFHEISCLQLLGNYKLWHSISNKIAYDYSGNQNHAYPVGNYLYLDRGLCDNKGSRLDLVNNTGYQEATISIWHLYRSGTFQIRFLSVASGMYSVYNSSHNFLVYNKLTGTYSQLKVCGSDCYVGNV